MIPAVGGALVGPIVYCFAREAKGHGVPEVMLAIAQEGGRIRPRVVFVKALASAICIGSGGSAGREGPIVQIGSALGSALGQGLKLPPGLLRTVLAAGAAGGIAATFNAPIGGVVFSLEVLLRDFSARAFSVLVLASVTATVISRALLGNSPAFIVPPYELKSPWELLFYALLGCLAALVAKGFIWLLYRCEDLFDALGDSRVPEAGRRWALRGADRSRPATGLRRGIRDRGAGPARAACPPGCWPPWWWASWWRRPSRSGPADRGACSRRPSSWGRRSAGASASSSGGLWPGLTAAPGAYALVGMAAVFTGAAHAPITSVLILFEMSGDYRIILPLMTAVVISTLVSHVLEPGDDLHDQASAPRDRHPDAPPAGPSGPHPGGDVMGRSVVTLNAELPFRAVLDHIRTHPYTSVPVLDGNGKLAGILGYSELREILSAERPEETLTARDFMRTPPPVCYPDDTLTEVTEKFRLADEGRLPVVASDDPGTVLGVISHTDVLAAYERLVLDQGGA